VSAYTFGNRDRGFADADGFHVTEVFILMRTAGLMILASIAAVLYGPPAWAQEKNVGQRPPIFRVNSNLVIVDITGQRQGRKT